MKRLKAITFEYEDGSMDQVIDPRAALLFQSRCNSAGIWSGAEEFILPVTIDKTKDEPAK